MNLSRVIILNYIFQSNSLKKLLVFILVIGFMFTINQVYAIESGPQVPNSPNTINKYCSNGTCNTGTLANIETNPTLGTKHLPILYVVYSQTCEIMVKNHIPGCPPLDTMIPYDTSNQYISGHFVKQGNDTIRNNPQVKNNWLYYEGKTNKTVCVECTADIVIMQQSQQIIIQPNDFKFVDKNANIVKGNWTSFNGRYMQGCDVATIANIPGLLNETISYMLNNCIKTSFNGTTTHLVKEGVWEWNNPFSTLHQDEYLKSIVHGHTYNGNNTSGGNGPQDCIRKTCSYSDPYKKAGW